MARKFLTPIDLNGLQLLNVRLQNLASEPAHAAGRIYFDTVLETVRFSDGTTWTSVGAGEGGGLDEEAVQAIVAAMIAGGHGISVDYDEEEHTITLSVAGLSTADISDFTDEVNAAIAVVVGAAPDSLDTLAELAAALDDDADFSATVIGLLAAKADISSLATVATSGDFADLTGVPRYAETIGDGSTTSFVITHGLGTRDVQVSVYLASDTYEEVEVDVQRTSTTTITVVFAVAPAEDAYRVVVSG